MDNMIIQIRTVLLKCKPSVTLGTLYGHKELLSAYSGFVFDEKNTRFSVVAIHTSALQEIHL